MYYLMTFLLLYSAVSIVFLKTKMKMHQMLSDLINKDLLIALYYLCKLDSIFHYLLNKANSVFIYLLV